MEIETFALLKGGHPIDGVSASASHVVVAVHGRAVDTYEISERRNTASWPIRSDIHFTIPPLEHPSGTFLAVTGGKTLQSWTQESHRPDQWQSRAFAKEIAFMFADRVLPHHCILVMRDGSTGLVSLDLASADFSPLPTASETTWSAFARLPNAATHSLFLISATAANVYSLNIFDFSPEGPTLQFRKSHPITSEKGVSLSSCVLEPLKRSLSLVWSDATWQVFDLSPNPYLAPTVRFTRTFIGFDALKKGSKGKAIWTAAFQPNVMFVAGKRNGSLNSSLWDLQYGTLLNEHTAALPDKDSKSAKHEEIIQVLCTDHKFAVIALTSSVTVCPIHCPAATLALSLGKLAQGAAYLAPLTPATSAIINLQRQIDQIPNTADSLTPDLLLPETILASDASETESIALLCDRTQTPNEATFMTEFQRITAQFEKEHKPYVIMHHLDSEMKNSQKARKRRLKQQDTKREAERRVTLSPNFVQSVAQRCIEDKYWDAVRYLIKSGNLYLATVPQLIPALINEGHLDLIELCLTTLWDISEEVLMRLLKYFISEAPRDKMVEHLSQKKLYKRKPDQLVKLTPEQAVNNFVNLVMVKPVNVVFMQQYLKNLAIDQVEFLLHYLKKWTSRHSASFGKVERSSFNVRTPEFTKVIEWISMLLDAHLSKLVLLPQFAPLLQSLSSLIQSQVSLCNRAQLLKGALAQFSKRNALPADARESEYLIEVWNPNAVERPPELSRRSKRKHKHDEKKSKKAKKPKQQKPTDEAAPAQKYEATPKQKKHKASNKITPEIQKQKQKEKKGDDSVATAPAKKQKAAPEKTERQSPKGGDKHKTPPTTPKTHQQEESTTTKKKSKTPVKTARDDEAKQDKSSKEKSTPKSLPSSPAKAPEEKRGAKTPQPRRVTRRTATSNDASTPRKKQRA